MAWVSLLTPLIAMTDIENEGCGFFFSESKESLRILYSRVLHKGITNKSIMMVLPLKKSMCIEVVSICISINGYSKDIAWYGHSIQYT